MLKTDMLHNIFVETVIQKIGIGLSSLCVKTKSVLELSSLRVKKSELSSLHVKKIGIGIVQFACEKNWYGNCPVCV